MGIDAYTCDKCTEAFMDVLNWEECELCGDIYCDECAEEAIKNETLIKSDKFTYSGCACKSCIEEKQKKMKQPTPPKSRVGTTTNT